MDLSPVLPFLLSTLLGLSLSLHLNVSRRLRAILLWASPATGIGITALLFFLWSVAFYPTFAPLVYFGLEALLTAAALLFFLRRRRSQEEPAAPSEPDQRSGWAVRLPVLVLCVCLVFAVLLFLSRLLESPYGEWDAWAIWNMRARYLFEGGEQWRNGFSRLLHGADYPVLISFYIARSWALVGRDLQTVPQMLAAVFTTTTAGLLYAAVSRARSVSQGLVAAIVLTCTPAFLYWGASQYADIPLGFYFLAALVCLYFFNAGERGQSALLAAAGLFTGFALWTKNEGAFLLAGILAAQVAYWLLARAPLRLSRGLAWFLVGSLPALALLLFFKLDIAPRNYVFDQNTAGLVEKISSDSRYKLIFQALQQQFITFGGWKLPLLPLLLVYGSLAGIDRPRIRKEKKALAILAMTLLAILLADIGAYLITPLPLEWQIRQSIDRLLLQLLPAFLFLLFLVIRNPLSNRRPS